MKRTIAALILLSLSACQTTRYVTIPCVTSEQYKQLEQAEPPKIADKLTGKAGEDIKTIAGSNIRLRAWGRGNLDILGGCVG
jgi:hypothetical protein